MSVDMYYQINFIDTFSNRRGFSLGASICDNILKASLWTGFAQQNMIKLGPRTLRTAHGHTQTL